MGRSLREWARPFLVDGHAMVTRKEILHIARRYDTAMSRAMLRALGFRKRCPRRRHDRGHSRHMDAERVRFRGIEWCFRNHQADRFFR